ncbi:MAG TPA: DUF1801 domain-containing protein [Flavipsychrobacter sp.]|nr:DUF1801 domain-containing protein [Flavipsychrobacter sp.]
MKVASKFKTVDEYMSLLPKNEKVILEGLRKTIKQIVPKAEEVISYGMPAFKQNGILVWYAVHKEHIGLYPRSSAIQAFKNELSGYTTSKGAIQFPITQPIPTELVKSIVKFRAIEDMESVKSKAKKVANKKTT